jgi:hypothetical protein
MAARCAAAASCAALATWVPRARCDRATPPRPAADDGDDDALARGRSRRPYRVLVVGAGLSGALAAKELRRRFSEEDSEERDDGSECNGGEKRGLHLAVWERASYPAGRFGARARHAPSGAAVDLGAQVRRCLNECN